DPHLGTNAPDIETTTSKGADGRTVFTWSRKDHAPLRQRGETLKIVVWPMRNGAPVRDGKPLLIEDQLETDSWTLPRDAERALKEAGPTWIEVRIVGEHEQTVQQAPLEIGAAAAPRDPSAQPLEARQLRDLLVAVATAPDDRELTARTEAFSARFEA